MFERELWVAPIDNENVIISNGAKRNRYKEPIKYKFNYQPTSGNTDYLVYGTLINKMYTAFIDYKKYIGKIHEGDKAYLKDNDCLFPSELVELDLDDNTCKHANYRIKLVQPQNFKIKVIFEKITKGE